jgi:hypothetical protein
MSRPRIWSAQRGSNGEILGLQGVYESAVCHMAFFRDPDGNALILHHRHAPYADGSLP